MHTNPSQEALFLDIRFTLKISRVKTTVIGYTEVYEHSSQFDQNNDISHLSKHLITIKVLSSELLLGYS